MDIVVAWAFILGVMCSVSLLIGALLGIYFKMSKRIVGLMAAFGAGALLSALAIELVAPSIDAFMQASTAGFAREDDSAVIKIFPGIELPQAKK